MKDLWRTYGKIGEHVVFSHDFPLNVRTKPDIETVWDLWELIGLYQI